MVELFGKPQPVQCFDEKVTKRWVISTPRGYVEVRDYWWNQPDEWSIAAAAKKPTQWAKRFLRRNGLAVS